MTKGIPEFFREKVIIVTGASSGIGLAAVRLFSSFGAKIVMASRNIDRMTELSGQMLQNGAEILCVKTDVSIESDCKNLIDKTIERFGRIDVLINNAGLSMRARFQDVNLDVIRKLMDVNFWGTIYCTKYALPWILQSKGSLVGVISTAGYVALPGRTGYVTSKFAIRGFLETLRTEHLEDNIHIMIFAPGYTKSNVRNAALLADGTPQGSSPKEEDKLMTAEAVAEKLAEGIYKRKREMILTAVGFWDVQLYKRFPRIMEKVQLAYIRKKETDIDPCHK